MATPALGAHEAVRVEHRADVGCRVVSPVAADSAPLWVRATSREPALDDPQATQPRRLWNTRQQARPRPVEAHSGESGNRRDSSPDGREDDNHEIDQQLPDRPAFRHMAGVRLLGCRGLGVRCAGRQGRRRGQRLVSSAGQTTMAAALVGVRRSVDPCLRIRRLGRWTRRVAGPGARSEPAGGQPGGQPRLERVVELGVLQPPQPWSRSARHPSAGREQHRVDPPYSQGRSPRGSRSASLRRLVSFRHRVEHRSRSPQLRAVATASVVVRGRCAPNRPAGMGLVPVHALVQRGPLRGTASGGLSEEERRGAQSPHGGHGPRGTYRGPEVLVPDLVSAGVAALGSSFSCGALA